MRLTKVPSYSASELERRAEDLLRSRCGWPPPIPVDIEFLVDQEPGVLLDILPGLRAGCGVAGLVRYPGHLRDGLVLFVDLPPDLGGSASPARSCGPGSARGNRPLEGDKHVTHQSGLAFVGPTPEQQAALAAALVILRTGESAGGPASDPD